MITLSGHITGIPQGKSATVNLTGDASRQTQTDDSGNYSFDVPEGSYELTFELEGEQFIPPSIAGTFNQDTILPTVSGPADPNNVWLGVQVQKRQR